MATFAELVQCVHLMCMKTIFGQFGVLYRIMVISSWYYPSKENVTLDMVVFVLCFNVIFMGMMDIKQMWYSEEEIMWCVVHGP